LVIDDADFPRLSKVVQVMIDKIQNSGYEDITIGSTYTKGGFSIIGRPFRRRLISRSATRIVQFELKMGLRDAVSSFFVCKCHMPKDIDININSQGVSAYYC
jgi:dolichol-phosphate mannosyltransferase